MLWSPGLTEELKVDEWWERERNNKQSEADTEREERYDRRRQG